MYRMPQPVGGFSPNQDYIQDQGYRMPQPVGGFNPYHQSNNNFSNNYTDDDIESEYEYITDDEGDYVEDEHGAIYTLDEAQKKGLIKPTNNGGERGIGTTFLLGSAFIGALMLRKQIKKKKRVKKQNHNTQTPQMVNTNTNTNNTMDDRQNIYPFLKNNTPNTSTPTPYQYPNQTPNVYGQNGYGQPPSYPQNNPYGTPLYPNYNSYNGYSGYCYNNCNNVGVSTW